MSLKTFLYGFALALVAMALLLTLYAKIRYPKIYGNYQEPKKSKTRSPWLKKLCLLYGGELVLAILLSMPWVETLGFLSGFTSSLAKFIPVIGRFDRSATFPVGDRVFITLTLGLCLLKTYWSYTWLMSNGRQALHANIASPLFHGKGGDALIQELLDQDETKVMPNIYSFPATVFSSLMIILYAASVVFASLFLWGAPDNAPPPSLHAKYNAMATGGIGMWLSWPVVQMSFVAFVLSIAVCVVQEWAEFFKRLLRN